MFSKIINKFYYYKVFNRNQQFEEFMIEKLILQEIKCYMKKKVAGKYVN